MGDKNTTSASSNGRSSTPSASQRQGSVLSTRTRANTAASPVVTPNMGNPAGDSTILGMIVSPVKDHETAVQFLTTCGLWGKQSEATVQQTVTALRRALLQVALYTGNTVGNPTVCNTLLALYHIVCAHKGELATGAWEGTAIDLTADAAEAIGNRVHETVLEFLSGDKDLTTADGAEKPSLLRIIDDSVARHCELLKGTVQAEAILTRERVEDARKSIVESSKAHAPVNSPRLYSEALLGGSHADRFSGRSREEQDSIARVDVQERQILIDPDTTTSAVWADGTPLELIERANMAIESVRDKHPLSADDPLNGTDKLKVLSVSKLRNRGVLFNFGDKRAVDWVRRHRAVFLASFDAAAILRDRGYQVLVKNVPVELDILKSDTLRAIEKANGFATDSILRAKWLRPIVRRRPGQKNAHLCLVISSPSLANSLITSRIVIEGNSLQVERLMPDPIRCAKCQRHGHMVKECRQQLDTCGNCAHEHETVKCIYPEDYLCINCKGKDGLNARHAAWDRNCPSRLSKLEEMRRRRPEDFTRLFLTSNNADTVLPRSQPLVTVRYEADARRARAQQRDRLPPRGHSESAAPRRSSARTSNTPSRPARSGSVASQRSARSRSRSKSLPQTVLPVDDHDHTADAE